MSGMQRLPAELFILILSFLDTKSLRTCALVQQHWATLAQAILLRAINVDILDAADLVEAFRRRGIAHHVLHIALECRSRRASDTLDEWNNVDPTSIANALVDALGCCSRLETLEFGLLILNSPKGERSHPLVTACLFAIAPQVTHLRGYSAVHGANSPALRGIDELLPNALRLPRLVALHVRYNIKDVYPTMLWCGNALQVLDLSLRQDTSYFDPIADQLAAIFPHVHTIRLGVWHHCAENRVSFTWLSQFPRLKTLELFFMPGLQAALDALPSSVTQLIVVAMPGDRRISWNGNVGIVFPPFLTKLWLDPQLAGLPGIPDRPNCEVVMRRKLSFREFPTS